jgi:cell division ATPase FtsA
LIEAAVDSGTGELDEVIDSRFLSFKLDNASIDPLTFSSNGREISAQIKLATHPKLILADIVAAMNGAGIEISEFRSTGFGLATAVSILKPNASNCVLVDIGHSVTTGVLTVGGALHSIFSIAAGSDHITRDLVAGLSCEYSAAEIVKNDSGIKLDGTSDSPTEANIQRIMKPRISEIMQLAFKNFALYARSLDGGFMLVGAGSQLKGLSQFISKFLGVTTPFICALTPSTGEALTKLKFEGDVPHLNSGWLALLSHVRLIVNESSAIRLERNSRPMSKLRPLWTWLSELSR